MRSGRRSSGGRGPGGEDGQESLRIQESYNPADGSQAEPAGNAMGGGGHGVAVWKPCDCGRATGAAARPLMAACGPRRAAPRGEGAAERAGTGQRR